MAARPPPASVPTTASVTGPEFERDQRANRILRIPGRRNGSLRIGHHHPPGIAEHIAPGNALEQGDPELLLQQRDAA